MTIVSDEIIRLLNLGGSSTFVMSSHRGEAFDLLKSDPKFDASIKHLHTRKLLKAFFNHYSGYNTGSQTPDFHVVVVALAGRANDASAAMIEKALKGLHFPPQAGAFGHFGFVENSFNLAHELARSMRDLGLLAVSAGRPSTVAKISKKNHAHFTGSGATGRKIFEGAVFPPDLALVAIEQHVNSDRTNEKDRGPRSFLYTNPGLNGMMPKSKNERRAQALRVTSLPISTLFEALYPNGPPSRAAVIREAAKKYELTPAVIGAIILTEQRDQSYNEDLMDYDAATHIGYRRTTSIGLGQVRDDTVSRNDAFSELLREKRKKKLTPRQISVLLACDEFNIFATAKYIRLLANEGSTKTASDLPETVKLYPDIDFAAYAKHASHWSKTNIAALGSEYTSTGWDDKLRLPWGKAVATAWNDMKNAKVGSMK